MARIKILALEAVAVVVVANYLWVRAVQHLAPGFEDRSFRIWFWGPLFSRREQFTEEGWRYRRLANAIAWTGLAVFVVTALVFLR